MTSPLLHRAKIMSNDSVVAVITAIVLAVAVFVGGGGSPAPVAELIVASVATLGGCVLVVARPPSTNVLMRNRIFWAAVAVLVALPVVQLVPLPPELWRKLPGRQDIDAGLDLLAGASNWHPISLFPVQTLGSLVAMIPGIVVFYGVSNLGWPTRVMLIFWMVALALVSALVALLQFVGTIDAVKFYPDTPDDFGKGFFANRNALPDFLAIGAFATLALVRIDRRRFAGPAARLLVMLVIVMLALATLSTGSRSGIVLLLLVACASVTTWFSIRGIQSRVIASAALVIGALVVATLLQIGNFDRVGNRFRNNDDGRVAIWRDSVALAGAAFPIGNGMGTFRPSYAQAESLDGMSDHYMNRAHNDYIETVVENGIAGPAVLLFVGALLAIAVRRAARAGGIFASASWLCCWSASIVALHSLTDYPMRTLAMSGIAGLVFGVVSWPPVGKTSRQPLGVT